MNEFASVNLIAVSLCCGVICTLFYWDFSRPYTPETLFYSVARRRYLLALSVYVAGYLLFFILLVGFLQRLFVWLWPLIGQLPFQDPNNWKPSVTIVFAQGSTFGSRQISLSAALLITVLLPYLPLTRNAIKLFRRFAHFIALYPQSVQLILAMIARSEFKVSANAEDALQQELDHYSVPKGELGKVLSRSAIQLLEEVRFLRAEFAGLGTKRPYCNFIKARSDILIALDKTIQRIFQRVAKALLNIGIDKRQSNILSQFVAEDCQGAVFKYRELVAEVALSCASHRLEREQLIEEFGYSVSFPPSIPFLPLAFIFGLDFVILLWPLLLAPWLPLGHVSPDTSLHEPLGRMQPNPVFLAGFALAHAISLTAALLWAIYPRLIGGIPLTKSLARNSLLADTIAPGLLSYFTSILIFVGMRLLISPNPIMPMATHPVYFIALNSMQFCLLTICICALVAVRMRDDSMNYSKGRWRDAIVTTVPVMTFVIGFQLTLLPMLPSSFDWRFYVPLFLAASAFVYFWLGFFCSVRCCRPSESERRIKEASADRAGDYRSGQTAQISTI